MKYLLSRIMAGLILAGFLGVSAYGQSRIATIDLGKVFDNYWKTKQAQTIIKERRADIEKEYNNMVQDRKTAREEYDKLMAEANDPAVSAEEREKRKRAAEDKLKYLRDQEEVMQQYQRQAAVTIEEQTKRLRDNILSEIRTIVNARAKSAAYSLVIDVAAETVNRTPFVLYSSNEHDLTQDVLKELNATAPASDAKSSPSTDSKK
ncbi:MAG TPA: OmpH family outer membrane protein [Candidatus Paceibacterota bacterium]|jgi:outer membrane protein|nr:OmpH family outer membrane protein [Candidatus Paceibacterota bacterium]HRT58491.1 OmpH family outer membrane protein [Candidatus Paceibacterota bacterium]